MARGGLVRDSVFFFFFITLGLELSDTKVYEPQIRALPGTASHFGHHRGPRHGPTVGS